MIPTSSSRLPSNPSPATGSHVSGSFQGTPDPTAAIDLRIILQILRQWSWLLLIGALIGAALGYAATTQSLPLYRTEVLILIEEMSPNNSSDYVFGRTSTYLELINQGIMLEKTATALNLDSQQLAQTVTGMRVESLRNTQLFRVYVEGYHPDYLAAVANALPDVLRAELSSVRTERFEESRRNLTTQIDALKAQIDVTQANIDRVGTPRNTQQENQLRDLQTILAQQQNSYANLVQSLENLRLVELQSLDNIATVRAAEVPELPVRSNTIPNLLLGSLIGVALALTAISLIEYLDDRVRSPQQIQDTLGLTVLGGIGTVPTGGNALGVEEKLITLHEPRHPLSEAYRSIRTNLRFTMLDSQRKTLAITSSVPGEGKSLTAANLAIVLAQLDQNVILIDADMRKPSLYRLFGIKQQPGLSDALIANDAAPCRYLHPVADLNLRLLPSGMIPPNPAELLSSQRMHHLLDALHAEADIVILDTPPLLNVTDAAVLTTHVSDILMVVNAKKTQQATLVHALEALKKTDAHLCGVVVNELGRSARHYGYGDAYYAYGATDATIVK